MKNPMELYYKKTGKSLINVLNDIINNNFKTKLTNDEKAQMLYELFCELHSDFMQNLLINISKTVDLKEIHIRNERSLNFIKSLGFEEF